MHKGPAAMRPNRKPTARPATICPTSWTTSDATRATPICSRAHGSISSPLLSARRDDADRHPDRDPESNAHRDVVRRDSHAATDRDPDRDPESHLLIHRAPRFVVRGTAWPVGARAAAFTLPAPYRSTSSPPRYPV